MSQNVWSRALIEQNESWLMLYFIAATGNRSEAEDLVQETFTQALLHADRFDPSRKLGPWLRGIARNVYLSHRRKTRHVLVLSNEMLDQLDIAVEKQEKNHLHLDYTRQRLEALSYCIGELSERASEIVRQRYFKQQTSKMIAEKLEISPMSVDLIISRSRRVLEHCINKKLRRSV